MSETTQRFRKLFAGFDQAHGQYDIDKELSTRQVKVSGKARTLSEPVTDEHYQLHLKGEQGLGIVPIRSDSKCVFAAIDIDQYENFDLVALQKNIVEKGLPLVLTRSKSGGAHCWLFLNEAVDAELAQKKLNEFSFALGYPGVEIFPKQKQMKPGDVGNWINLPFFNAEHTDRFGFDKNGHEIHELKTWLDYAEHMAISRKELIQVRVKIEEVPFFDGPPCLQALAKVGFPEGTRNQALFNIGVYCRKKYPDDWEHELDQLNLNVMVPPLGSKETQMTMRSLNRKDYGYTCAMPPINAVCRKDECLSRRYGIGGNDGGVEFESMLGGLRRSVIYDLNGNELDDENVKWFFVVAGHEITLTTAELFSQDRVRARVAERALTLPQKVRPQRWDAILREKIDNAELIEFHLESGTFGRIMTAVKEFCQEHGNAEARSDINQGLVWTDENGMMHFRSDALWSFLLKQKLFFPRDDQKQVHMVLKQLGAESRRMKGNLLIWSLPEFEIDEQPEPKPPKEHY